MKMRCCLLLSRFSSCGSLESWRQRSIRLILPLLGSLGFTVSSDSNGSEQSWAMEVTLIFLFDHSFSRFPVHRCSEFAEVSMPLCNMVPSKLCDQIVEAYCSMQTLLFQWCQYFKYLQIQIDRPCPCSVETKLDKSAGALWASFVIFAGQHSVSMWTPVDSGGLGWIPVDSGGLWIGSLWLKSDNSETHWDSDRLTMSHQSFQLCAVSSLCHVQGTAWQSLLSHICHSAKRELKAMIHLMLTGETD